MTTDGHTVRAASSYVVRRVWQGVPPRSVTAFTTRSGHRQDAIAAFLPLSYCCHPVNRQTMLSPASRADLGEHRNGTEVRQRGTELGCPMSAGLKRVVFEARTRTRLAGPTWVSMPMVKQKLGSLCRESEQTIFRIEPADDIDDLFLCARRDSTIKSSGAERRFEISSHGRKVAPSIYFPAGCLLACHLCDSVSALNCSVLFSLPW